MKHRKLIPVAFEDGEIIDERASALCERYSVKFELKDAGIIGLRKMILKVKPNGMRTINVDETVNNVFVNGIEDP